ncbi:MAG: aminotransferase class I/II-fold pyridoxal phosphate-dependent enzyme [Chloroflexi bacterium]|nr:aminotransferase class I/II-fold pyridoxal phosphate-dependent enzyme [Chloroflexota bacterium]
MKKEWLASRVQRVPPSGIRKFFDIIASMKDVISLGVGEPDFVTPDPIRRAGIYSLERGETKYTSNSGMFALRRALSEHLERLYSVRYDPETEILITVGVSEALHLAMLALIEPGDEVIVPQPCFVSYVPSVIFAGGEPVVIETRGEDTFQIDVGQLERSITPRTKAILFGYPNNPTGAVLERERALRVTEIAERHDLLVISDEIYDRLVYGIQHTCFASLPRMRERTVFLSGFSKDYAMTGWRIGYVCSNAGIIGAIRKLHQYVIMSAPTTGQVAAIEALRSGEPYVKAMVEEYNARRQVMLSGLNDIGLDCFEPRGAFYCFPSIARSGMSSEQFSERLLFEKKVAVVPGVAFGACGEGHVRMAYAASLTDIEEALGRIEDFLKGR